MSERQQSAPISSLETSSRASLRSSLRTSLRPSLPRRKEPWPREKTLYIGPENDQDDIDRSDVKNYTHSHMWTWTGKDVFFFSDIHADADAFFLSLEATGGIKRTGSSDEDFKLTKKGKQALFIIGGDCFDKGPNNLRLLEVIHQLYLKGADIELLAGNHDIRTYLGIYYAESKDPLLDHLFVRMGKKTVPLLKEIYDRFIRRNRDQQLMLADPDIKQMLFPSEAWYRKFPYVAEPWVAPEKLDKELTRIREKTEEFEARAAEFGMDLNDVYAAVVKFRELFFEPEGRYFWFFDKMKLAHREGSYLFLHAGVDDEVAKMLYLEGIDELNERYKDVLENNPFELYHGVLGNVFRTKYREFDYTFTDLGKQLLHRSGIYALVHGHRNILQGQRLTIREGMLNFECDASVDCNTRIVEGLYGPGGAATIFQADGKVLGISTDYPYVKEFHPGSMTITRETNRANFI